MDPIDVSTLPRVGGTGAGGYYELEPGVLLAVPRPGYRQTLTGARASLQELNRLARERGRALVTIVLVNRVRAQDKGSRRVWSGEANPELMCGLALVGNSLLSRAIG